MATGMVLSVAQTLFAALQCKELRYLCSMFGYESQLHEIESTVTTIKAVLLEAESKHQELTPQGRVWIESLKDVVYEVDDVLDEFRTMALQRQQLRNSKFSKKVRRFLSRSNKFLVAFNTSLEIKNIKEKLENIAKNRKDFGFGDTYEPVKRRVETCSFVREESIIGRDSDKEAIVSMLLRENEENVSFVTIIGMGGLGKTALAQLVFNDDVIMGAFDLRMWVCVSDDFNFEVVLSKMLEKSGLIMDVLQRELRQKIEGRKYLLVLDDVWNQKRNEWFDLKDILKLGGKGSRVLVTSRLKEVARVVENNSMHELQGLSEENSWRLFKELAFEYGKEPTDSKVAEKGKEIAKACSGVPLSIRVIGSLLYGQDKRKWLSFNSKELSKMQEGKEGIMPILKFSYDNLTPPLKSCFSYCALFPKDFIIEKQFLIDLWAAQGCLDELQDGGSIEDVGEEYFSTLLQRCFLQDIENGEYEEIYSCKMHDLIHDLAQYVAGKEFSSTITTSFDNKVRHICNADSTVRLFAQNYSLAKLSNLRTILEPNFHGLLLRQDLVCDVAKIFANCRRLRVLELRGFGIRVIPNNYNNLIHLRYLDLSGNRLLETLPKSISKLLNLQVLKLRRCWKLRELPEDLRELVNLRKLDLYQCDSITHMPAGLDNLTCLHTLTAFVLGTGSSNHVHMEQLQNLKHLSNNLKGTLTIIVKEGYSYNAANVGDGGYLVNKPRLKALTIRGECVHVLVDDIHISGDHKPHLIDEKLLDGLKPHCNVKNIHIGGYVGIKLPQWVTKIDYYLPSLVSLTLTGFPKLQQLPALSQLQHLKSLSLGDLDSVEYMEDDRDVNIPQSSRTTMPTFFPSLEQLYMWHLPKLKGWWREDIQCLMEHEGQADMHAFSHLRVLSIVDCSSMKFIPRFQRRLKFVKLQNLNERLTFMKKSVEASGREQTSFGESAPSTTSSSNLMMSSNNNDDIDKNRSVVVGYDLERLEIDSFRMLNSLFGESLRVGNLNLGDSKIQRLTDAGIELLKFDLQSLTINDCENLELGEEGDGMMPWKTLHTLPSLSLQGLTKVVKLPKGFQYLTSLQSLDLMMCINLEGLPEWLDSLVSLQSITIFRCPKIKSLPEAISRLPSLIRLEMRRCDKDLVKRCKGPDGEDWPKISHIATLNISQLEF